jgi:hypothetical protein
MVDPWAKSDEQDLRILNARTSPFRSLPSRLTSSPQSLCPGVGLL